MSGMEPMLIGAALGGGVSAARGGNPLTGALMGGITGGIGSGIYSAAQGAAGAAAGTQAAAGMAAQPALSYGAMNTAAGQAMANPGLLATMKEIPNAIGTYAQQNPFMAMQGLDMANNMMQPSQVQMPQAMPMQTRGLQDAPIGGILAQQMQRQPISLI
ncbi:MAG: hypothetical protein NBV65_02110 [Burkholderiaceae bacterium]|nr:hypothetical protein [Burkholderiaceae bacterium]